VSGKKKQLHLASKITKACYFIMHDQVEFDVKKLFGTGWQIRS
jgi:hypothetical protein